MSFIKADYRITEDETLHAELLKTMDIIVDKIAAEVGGDCSVRLDDDHRTAFGGTKEKPELVLTLEWQKCFGHPCICASLDDTTIWQEWDFGTRDRCVREIAGFISAKIKKR